MESENERQADAHESLEALAEVRLANASRLQRPRRYWIMVASILAILALIPLISRLPPPAAYAVAPALIVLVAVATGWKQSTVVRKVRVRGLMWLPFVICVSALAVGVGMSFAASTANGWWWLPIVTASVVFAAVLFGGPALDRYWAHRASYASAQEGDDA